MGQAQRKDQKVGSTVIDPYKPYSPYEILDKYR